MLCDCWFKTGGDHQRGSLFEFWQNIQRVAEDHYDRTSDRRFTTSVGYE